GSPSLTLPIANRVHDNTGFEKSNSSNSLYTNYVVISVTDGVYEDNIQISFGSNGSINFEDGWDATKMFGADFAPQLYMIEDNLELAFNHLAEIENQDSKYVNLYFSCGVEGLQTLNFDLSNYSYSEIILEDKETNTFQDLLQNQSYTFDANFSDDEDRFVIHFGNKLTDIKSNQDISPLYIYANDKTVFIKNSESEGQIIIEIYDLLGRKLLNEISHNNLTSYSLNISNSFVVVKASSKNGTKLEKVFIK
ncbi:MAG: hypothetical protein C0598_10025, partial [Marinilabiliales bacterium]